MPKSLFKEIKDAKFEKLEKIELKEFRREKFERWEKWDKPERKEFKELKPEVEGLKLDASEVEIFQPEEIWQRFTDLELKVEQLSHFITREQRPDLTRGALQGEPAKPAAARRSTGTTRRRKPRG
jgi:hypothetical protein